MPIHKPIAFGNAAVTGGYATILATYTQRDINVFQGLDGPHHSRFTNEIGEQIPRDLVPSETLVKHIQQQLCQVLGMCMNPSFIDYR